MTYDYIIAGAGSAGCILAERLSASGQYSVLLLEAGGKDSSFWFKIPVGFAKMYYNPVFNWMYYSQPQVRRHSPYTGERLHLQMATKPADVKDTSPARG